MDVPRYRHNSTFKVSDPKPRRRLDVGTAPKKRIGRRGKKAALRESINRRNRVRFRAMGLYDVCEVKFPQCWNTDLTWAHGKKDKFLTMEEREFLVVRACTVCHRILDEELGHQGMFEAVTKLIENRVQKERAA